MKYEYDREDLYRLASFVRAEIRENGEEVQFKYCPYCHGGDNRDKYTFAVNRETGAFNCLRSSCGKQGHFVTLARDMGFALDFGIARKEYRRLPQREIHIRPAAARILGKRGISEEICRRYKITTQKDNQHILTFPFYNDWGELVTVKYRNANYKKGIDKNK